MPGGITPNGSVKWFIEGDSYTAKKLPNGKHRLEGEDGTRKNQYFKIIIQHPSRSDNRALFLLQLQQQVLQAIKDRGVKAVTLFMPVEDAQSGYRVPSSKEKANYRATNPDHWRIYVDWSAKVPSVPRVPPGASLPWRSKGGGALVPPTGAQRSRRSSPKTQKRRSRR
jgi:hypothetical protein